MIKKRISWNKGLTKETDNRLKKCGKNISKAKKGCKPWNKGKKGLQVAWNKGKKMSEEQKKKVSDGHKKLKTHSGRFKKGHSVNKNIRRKISKANRNKIRLKSRGKNNPMWKGGVTPENLKIRMSVEYRLWRRKVFKRDNWTCQKTGIKGGILRAHHIQNFAQHPELRFAIDNGITLSDKAHRKFHKIYGKKNNTKEQLEEFLNN